MAIFFPSMALILIFGNLLIEFTGRSVTAFREVAVGYCGLRPARASMVKICCWVIMSMDWPTSLPSRSKTKSRGLFSTWNASEAWWRRSKRMG